MIEAKRSWGWMEDGVFRPLPRWPGWEGVPPCDVTLPSGEVRHVIWQPGSEEEEPTAGPHH